ncbi:serine hydrolase domain-containing protein [Bacillus rubiinfantis]|uniref:serine hydrolase domain-containing protein n=1 Tax=Bacillus rubiinfantis TaxID=1499680 RepID=UPI0005AB13FC|nr:serine hydrolase domain-containing protein [Bacillus rubiinfantis]
MVRRQQAATEIEKLFRKTVQKDAKIHNAYMLVHSDKLGIHVNMAEGTTRDIAATPQQPYFIASVSKLITAVLTGIFVEQNIFTYEDPISNFLDEELLQNLHIYRGRDYSKEIKIKHLLSHTSGLHDVLEDQPKQGKSFVDCILDEPSRRWTAREVVMWAKQHLEPHFPPEQGFHYSDTGYHLLGLTFEKITGKPYGETLKEYIFAPLEMNHSYLVGSQPIEKSDQPVADLYLRNINIKDYESLSIMHAGGGIISTNEDLLKFMKALVQHHLVREETITTMKQHCRRFVPGIHYGYGMMVFKTIPILMPEKYNVWGNAGSTGTFMFYHPATDTYLIGGLHQFRHNRKGIKLMLKTIDKLIK